MRIVEMYTFKNELYPMNMSSYIKWRPFKRHYTVMSTKGTSTSKSREIIICYTEG